MRRPCQPSSFKFSKHSTKKHSEDLRGISVALVYSCLGLQVWFQCFYSSIWITYCEHCLHLPNWPFCRAWRPQWKNWPKPWTRYPKLRRRGLRVSFSVQLWQSSTNIYWTVSKVIHYCSWTIVKLNNFSSYTHTQLVHSWTTFTVGEIEVGLLDWCNQTWGCQTIGCEGACTHRVTRSKFNTLMQQCSIFGYAEFQNSTILARHDVLQSSSTFRP